MSCLCSQLRPFISVWFVRQNTISPVLAGGLADVFGGSCHGAANRIECEFDFDVVWNRRPANLDRMLLSVILACVKPKCLEFIKFETATTKSPMLAKQP